MDTQPLALLKPDATLITLVGEDSSGSWYENIFGLLLLFGGLLKSVGRKTIGKGEVNLPNFIEYSDLNNLIELIVEESKYIGKVREDVANSLKNHFLGNEWLDLNFWND